MSFLYFITSTNGNSIHLRAAATAEIDLRWMKTGIFLSACKTKSHFFSLLFFLFFLPPLPCRFNKLLLVWPHISLQSAVLQFHFIITERSRSGWLQSVGSWSHFQSSRASCCHDSFRSLRSVLYNTVTCEIKSTLLWERQSSQRSEGWAGIRTLQQVWPSWPPQGNIWSAAAVCLELQTSPLCPSANTSLTRLQTCFTWSSDVVPNLCYDHPGLSRSCVQSLGLYLDNPKVAAGRRSLFGRSLGCWKL